MKQRAKGKVLHCFDFPLIVETLKWIIEEDWRAQGIQLQDLLVVKSYTSLGNK